MHFGERKKDCERILLFPFLCLSYRILPYFIFPVGMPEVKSHHDKAAYPAKGEREANHDWSIPDPGHYKEISLPQNYIAEEHHIHSAPNALIRAHFLIK